MSLPVRPLTADDLATLTEKVRRRVIHWFKRLGFLDADAAADMLAWKTERVFGRREWPHYAQRPRCFPTGSLKPGESVRHPNPLRTTPMVATRIPIARAPGFLGSAGPR